ncbi:MAG: response regulator transcription factor [Pirellulales bacterium]|nr:response regulator transcription factor [Pirellulales bacterium]
MAHILIVEDDPHIARALKLNLEAEGYDASISADGQTALALLGESSTTIDLVILDLMLPGLSGYAVCESLRNRQCEIPIVILSARTLTEDRVRGFDSGADVYLHKPFDLEELLSVVRNLLNRRSRGRIDAEQKTTGKGATYAFGDASVNFDTYEVTVHGKLVRLTTLEIKLLRYFIEHEGMVVSRSELLEEVWGLAHTPTTRTVDNFILNLRKTFEQDPANPRHFLSIRGTGYRFVARPQTDPPTGDG